MWYMHEGMGWWMLFGGFWMLLIWAGLTALVIWGIKNITGNREKHNTALSKDIARERYARGEISRKEFEEIIGDLGRKV